MRIRSNFFLIIPIISIILAISFFLGAIREDMLKPYYIFEDFSECENIERLKTEDATITPCDSSEDGKLTATLRYAKFYGARYESKKLNFTIYAYEFSTEADAKDYFLGELKGMDMYDDNLNFANRDYSKNDDRTIHFYYKKNAYTIKGKTSESRRLDDFLKEAFSVRKMGSEHI